MRQTILAVATIMLLVQPEMSESQTRQLQRRFDSTATAYTARIDSLRTVIAALQLAEARVSRYDDILEKTNNQLNLWWNPYGMMVASLVVLFTILAIAVAFVLFRQGAEYRNLLGESIRKYEEVLKGFMEERKKELELRLKKMEDGIGSAKKEEKTKSEKEITDLKAQIGQLRGQIDSIHASSPALTGIRAFVTGRSGYSGTSTFETPMPPKPGDK